MAAAFADLVREAAEYAADGRRDAAVAAYEAALAERPGDPGVLHNLGVMLAEAGDLASAIQHFDGALAAEPGYVSAHFNRANACRALGRASEAADGLRRVIALEPDHHEAHRALGFLWLALGDRDRSLDHFARTYDLRRGDDRTGIADRSLRAATREKLLHDAALFRHLPPRARDGQRFELVARAYDAVAGEIGAEAGESETELSADQLARLGADYNTALHVIDAPEIPRGTIGDTVDAAAIARAYEAASPGIAWFDGLLCPDALTRLRRFFLQSTIWHDFSHIGGFVASYLEDGLACPLILQIADELRAALPDILGPHPLSQAWAFKGLRGTEPIALHADDGAVSVNFWVTPDAANLDPDRGGLVVHRRAPPVDWQLTGYGADRARIEEFLDEDATEAVSIPYRENRAVLFESRLFHGSDAPKFAAGYENHRINVTLLYGTAGISGTADSGL